MMPDARNDRNIGTAQRASLSERLSCISALWDNLIRSAYGDESRNEQEMSFSGVKNIGPFDFEVQYKRDISSLPLLSCILYAMMCVTIIRHH